MFGLMKLCWFVYMMQILQIFPIDAACNVVYNHYVLLVKFDCRTVAIRVLSRGSWSKERSIIVTVPCNNTIKLVIAAFSQTNFVTAVIISLYPPFGRELHALCFIDIIITNRIMSCGFCLVMNTWTDYYYIFEFLSAGILVLSLIRIQLYSKQSMVSSRAFCFYILRCNILNRITTICWT